MVKDDEMFDCYCFEASADATFEAVLEALIEEAVVTGGEDLSLSSLIWELAVLVEEAAATGGFVAMFGPPEVLEALEEEADGEPPAPGRLRGLTVLPGPWWPLR